MMYETCMVSQRLNFVPRSRIRHRQVDVGGDEEH